MKIVIKPNRVANDLFRLEAVFRDQNLRAHVDIRLVMGDYRPVFNDALRGYVVQAQPDAAEQVLTIASSMGFETVPSQHIAAD